jgi:glycerophosphoryl diester phosphodiesterase
MLGSVLRDLRLSWPQLALVDSLYKLLAFLVLWPVIGLALRLFVELSGRDDLADDDIVNFLLGPVGWATCVVIGALWVAILALQLAALMEILVRRDAGDGGVVAALWSTTRRATGVLRLAGELAWRLLAVAVPFLAVGGTLYWWLLTEHDVNYYLDTQPPAFWWAVVLIGGVLTVLALVMVTLVVRWSYALPLLLFEGTSAQAALRQSSQRSAGRRWQIVGWLVAWAVVTSLLSALACWLVAQAGQFFVPRVSGRWLLLMLTIGGLLTAWTAVNFIISVIGSTSLAALLLNLYRRVGRAPDELTEKVRRPPSALRITARHIVAALIAAVAVSAAVGAGAMVGVRLDDDTQIIAHRAGAASAPENTVAACEQAIADGTNWIEIDVQETSDGEVVVVHDRDLMKLGGSPLNIWNSAAAELRAIDVGSYFDPHFSDVRLATLGEMLDAAKAGKIGVVIELKHYGHAQRLEERVAQIVEAHDMVDHIVIMSLDAASLRRMHLLRPKWTIGRLTAVSVTDLTKQNVDFLAVSIRNATPDFIRRTHARGKQVYVWTVNDAPTMFEMVSRGADNLITDDPALARDVLDLRDDMGPIDRLFVEIAERFGTLPAHMYHDADF